MGNWWIISICLLYLIVLFGVAYYAEYRKKLGKSIINNPYSYALSFGVYCSAWTFYGSVGRASTNGLEFLAIYIGPTIGSFLFLPILSKILRISKEMSLVSLADFISTRYGKSINLASIITLFFLIGIIPYISIQLEAISKSISIFSQYDSRDFLFKGSGLRFDSLIITILLIIFIILFGTRSIQSDEKHEGLVAAVTFESIIKIVTFLFIGVYVSYVIFQSPAQIFDLAATNKTTSSLLVLNQSNEYFSWFTLMILSMFAFYLLPRQFQVSIVENNDESHLKKASWMFPMYLLIINLFVLPIAIAGVLTFQDGAMAKDYYMLSLPISNGDRWVALITFIGGFSAATSMIIVETIALSTMLSNNLIMPWVLSTKNFNLISTNNIPRLVQNVRRSSIIIIIGLAFIFDLIITQYFSLVSIGLISFVAVAQFAPAVIGGLYWKEANHNGALYGIISGFLIWFLTAIIPSMVDAGILSNNILNNGFFGIELLKPTSLLGISGLNLISHCFIWSIGVNTFVFVTLSLLTSRKDEEKLQAELFVDIEKLKKMSFSAIKEKSVKYRDLDNLISQFLGKDKAKRVISRYAHRHKIDITPAHAHPQIIAFGEKILGTIIGSASSHIMINNIAGKDAVPIEEVISILNESKQILDLNKELTKKTNELKKAHDQVTIINDQLKSLDEVKDEFLYTVTHEIRTPLTSIRALSEILYDNPDLEDDQKQLFLGNIVKETERLSHLITQVLNLEKFESGRQKLNKTLINMEGMISETVQSVMSLANENNITINTKIPDSNIIVSCDKDLIQQVIYNLLTNSVKFADTEINLKLFVNDEDIEISVEDDGPGIDVEYREKVFEKFFQAKNQTIKKPVGTGLGLAICKRIVELHDGNIEVRGGDQYSSKIVFNLPY